jgi:hypothetical protein
MGDSSFDDYSFDFAHSNTPGDQELTMRDYPRSASELLRVSAPSRLVRTTSAPLESTTDMVLNKEKEKLSKAERLYWESSTLTVGKDRPFGDLRLNDVDEDAQTSSDFSDLEPYCPGCQEFGHRKDDCPLCLKSKSVTHKTMECEVALPMFIKFMKLPRELRERIYGFALDADNPINPHLCHCSTNSAIKFHDDNQRNHGAVDKLLGLTRVNKEICEESLPIFYSVNVFNVGMDTTTYFDRLEYLGRFQLIRHVRFGILGYVRSEYKAAGILHCMNQFIKETNAFEETLSAPVGANYSSLVAHPQYRFGGLMEFNMLIALRKLTSSLTKTDATYSSKLVIGVPSVEAFAGFEHLRWFLTTLYGLGVSLHYLEGIPLDYNIHGVVGITWHQRFQKKDFKDKMVYASPVGNDGQTEAYRRALELRPNLEQEPRVRGYAYMRMNCGESLKQWCNGFTEGGGIQSPSGGWV